MAPVRDRSLLSAPERRRFRDVVRFLASTAVLAGMLNGALEVVYARSRWGGGFESGRLVLIGICLHGDFAIAVATVALAVLGVVSVLERWTGAVRERTGGLVLRALGVLLIVGALLFFRTASGTVGGLLVGAVGLPAALLPGPACAVAASLLGLASLRYFDPLLTGIALKGTFVNYSPETVEPILSIVLVMFVYVVLLGLHGTRTRQHEGYTDLLAAIVLLLVSFAIQRSSQILLVRLSVFPAMDYLTVASLVGSVLCLWVAIAAVAHRAGLVSFLSRPQPLPCLLLLLLTGSWVVGERMAAEPRLLLETQRTLSGTRWLVERAQGFFDRDRDGFSSLFGGGDCNDGDPGVNPNQLDIPGNGIDENCMGGDFDGAADPYLSLPVDFVPPTEPRGARKVILVTIDAMRADALGETGPGGKRLAPVLAALGAESSLYENAIAPSAYTQNSIPYLLALATRAPGIHKPELRLPNILASARVPSVAVLSDARPWGLVDPYIDSFDKRLPPPQYSWNADQLVDETIRVLRQSRNQSLFLWLHIPDLHDYDLFGQHSVFAWDVTNLRDAGINLSILLDLMNLGDMSRKLRGVYDAQLTRVNAAIARLLAELQKEPGSADTLLIVSADHGEEFNEHGGFFHGGTLYQEAIHVPLIVHGQTFPAVRIAAPVALYRLPATILDWFGFEGSSVESVSLRAGARATLPVFASSNSLGRKPPSFALIDYPLKLIYERAGSLEELYDLIEDPGEQRNRGEDPTLSERRKEMERALDRIMFHFEYGPERVQSLLIGEKKG